MSTSTRTARLARVCAGLLAVAALLAGPAWPDSQTGGQLAAAAIEAMGGAAAVAALETLVVTAECTGPNGAFSSTVRWWRGGTTMMSQSDATGQRTLLAVGEQAWQLDAASGAKTPLAEDMASMVHGHAVHPILFELDTRFHDHREAGTGEGGCLRIEMLDDSVRPASVCLDPATRLPTFYAFTPAGPGGEIEMRLSDWRQVGDLLYFNSFELRQGDEEYRWVYSTIRPNETITGPWDGAADRQSRGAWKPGERISLSLKNAALADVLRSFAQMAGFNLVLDPSVRGSVTVELQDVPWEQALETILKTHGLGAEVDGFAWHVRPR
jgi:hypothetical protein